jgi:hypothetical protein
MSPNRQAIKSINAVKIEIYTGTGNKLVVMALANNVVQ